MRDKLIDVYHDWVNNYLTLPVYAEHNGLTLDQARTLMLLATEVALSKHPEA